MTDAAASRYDTLAAIPPDGKDWTWTLDQRCLECGFDARGVRREEIGALSRAAAQRLLRLAGRPDLAERRLPQVWSPLEYLCHVRDVAVLFEQRVRLMLDHDDPSFANWDQDEAALTSRYADQSPPAVIAEVGPALETAAATFDGVREDQWARPGRRSNGSSFTVETLGRYFLHDVYHHLHDVSA